MTLRSSHNDATFFPRTEAIAYAGPLTAGQR